MAKEFKITSLRLADLEKELNYLRTTREREIAEIEDILAHAVIIEDENAATGRVGLGCTITVEDANGKLATYKSTGSQEANPMLGKLSDDSPFGRAAVGKGVGDSFTYNAPNGSYTMKIVEITREA